MDAFLFKKSTPYTPKIQRFQNFTYLEAHLGFTHNYPAKVYYTKPWKK
jgi:hypothetical protein